MALRWGWIAAVLFVAALGVGAYFYFSGPRYEAVQARLGPAVEAVYATGTVEPIFMSRAGPKIAGRISAIPVKEGQHVEAGDVLVSLDDREAQSLVNELQARLELAQADQARVSRLYRSGNVSAAARDQANANALSAEAALNAAKVRLSEHHIRAPAAGTVLRFDGVPRPGDLVRAGEALVIIGDMSSLWIEAEVDEEDVPRVEVGQKALIRSDGFAGQALEGEVSRITPFGDPVRRAYRVHIGLPEDTPLLPGMTTEINIIVRETDEAVLVPTAALAGRFVYVLEGGHALRRQVETGSIGAELAEIRSGVAQGEWVLLSPPAELADGARVRADKRGGE